MWIEERERMMRGERDRYIYIYIYTYIHEAFQRRRVAASNKTGWSPCLHQMLPKQPFIKERWRENNTTIKKKVWKFIVRIRNLCSFVAFYRSFDLLPILQIYRWFYIRSHSLRLVPQMSRLYTCNVLINWMHWVMVK